MAIDVLEEDILDAGKVFMKPENWTISRKKTSSRVRVFDREGS